MKILPVLPALSWFILVTSILGTFVTAEPEGDDLLTDAEEFEVEPDAIYELPVEDVSFYYRQRRSVPYKELGPAGYYPCAAPEGYRGSCKPKATCASYYATASRYDPYKSDKYKSCTYGYGYHGVCCPNVVYSGTHCKLRRYGRCLRYGRRRVRKPNVIKVPPQKRMGYNPSYKDVSPAAIQECIYYASVQIKGPFENDTDLGRGEDDDSYWGNGVVLETYVAELHDIGWAAYFILLVTQCLKDKYGYNTAASYDGGLELTKYMGMLPPTVQTVCSSFNIQSCSKSKYRTFDGTCNNLKNPYWGAARTSVSRLTVPAYPDGLWEIKKTGDGKLLPLPRYMRSILLPEKDVADPYVNLLHLYYGQFIAHDTSHVYFYQGNDGSFIDCCHGYTNRPRQVSPKCYAIELPRNDPFYTKVQQTCLNLARLALAPHDNCAAGYASQANRQTAHLDLSAVYGTSKAEADTLRNFEYGLMKMSKVGDQFYLPIDAKAECFNTSMGFCFKAGDLRNTMHPGITVLQTIWLRFHNYCAKKLYYLNTHWEDEKIFQECRRINIAVFQHITYSEYLAILLGWNIMYEHGILPVSDGYSNDYNERTNNAILAEFTGAVFRHHSAVYGHINILDENYKVLNTEMLANTFNNPVILKNPDNFDGILRGYIYTPQRAVDKYYDHQISLFLLRDQRKFGLDIGAINMERGRDYALRSYNDYRELCGLKRAYKWEDLYDYIAEEDVQRLRQQYASIDDVELYPAGLLERHQHDSMLGPTWWCIAAQQFKNWKVADRYFYDRGGPYGFTVPQLDQIRQTSMAGLLCLVTGAKKVPAFPFRPISESNPLYSCSDYEAIPRIDFGPWKSKPKPKAYKRAPAAGFY